MERALLKAAAMSKKVLLLGWVGLLWSCAGTGMDVPAAGGVASGGVASGGMASGGMASGGSGGASGASGGANGGPSSLADVQSIFDGRCVICHDKSKQGLPTFPQLSLVRTDALAALVNQAATETCGGVLVVPGDPDHSYLISKLTQAMPCDGQHMPRSFEGPISPPLDAQQLATIRSWISAGAQP